MSVFVLTVRAQTPVLSDTIPVSNFINEQFCFPVTITDSGGPGYGPYIRLILPAGVDFTGATFLGNAVTATNVGTFTVGPLRDPNLNTGTVADSVFGNPGETLWILNLPVGSVTDGGVSIVTQICCVLDGSILTPGVPVDITTQAVFEFGGTPTGSTGPTFGSIETGSIIPTLYTFDKTATSIEGEQTPGPSFPITYALTLDIANGQTLTNVSLIDNLPGTLQYIGNLTISGATGCVTNSTPGPGPGGLLDITCASAVGTTGAGDVLVSFQAYIVDTLDESIGGGACDTEPVINAATADADQGLPINAVAPINAVTLAISQTAAPAVVNPGTVVTYTVQYQVSDYVTAVDSLAFTIIVPDGMDYVMGSGLIDGVPVAENSVLTGVPGPGQTTVTFFIIGTTGPFGPGSTGVFTYQTSVNQNYVATGDPILARDELNATIFGDYHLTDESPGINGCTNGSQSSVSIAPITATKSIVNAQSTYQPGDLVTYNLQLVIPSGDLDDVRLYDYFPLPIHNVNDLTNLTAPGPFLNYGPAHTAGPLVSATIFPGTNSLELNFGNVSFPAGPITVSMYVSIPVTTIPYANGLFHSNFLVSSNDNTVEDSAVSLNPSLIFVGAPELGIAKGVSDPGNPGATLSSPPVFPIDGNSTGNDGSDVVTFVTTLVNYGGAPAYDVLVADPVPAGFSGCTLGSVTFGNGVPIPYTGTLFTSPTDTLRIDSLEASGDPGGRDTAYITYTCPILPGIDPGTLITNRSTATWASAPGQSSIFQSITDIATVQVRNPGVGKSLISITPNHSGTTNQVHVGEVLEYQVTINVPEGNSPNVTIVDQLDAGLAFVSLDTVFTNSANVTASAGPLNSLVPVFSTIGAAPAGLDRQMSLNLGNVLNTNTNNAVTERITLRYTVRVLNTTGNIRGTQLNNNVAWSWDGPSGRATVNAAAPAVTVIEADMDIDKTFLTSSLLGGDSAFVSLNFFHNPASNATAFDVTVSDSLPVGLIFLPGSFNVSCPFPLQSGPSFSGGVVSATFDSIPVGGNCTLSFKVQLDAAFPICDSIVNCAEVRWQSLFSGVQGGLPNPISNPFGVERTGDPFAPGQLNNYSDSACATMNVINGLANDPVITSNAPVCAGQSVTLSVPAYSGSVVNYFWSGPSVPPGFNSNQLVINPADVTDAGVYSVYVQVDGCISDTGFYTLVIYPNPIVTATNNGILCAPNSRDLQLTATVSSGTAPFTYAWTGPNAFMTNVQNPIVPNATSIHSGYYSVQVTDANGCTSNAGSTLVEITNQPNQPFIAGNSPICAGQTILLSTQAYAGNNVTYIWRNPANAIIAGAASNTLTIFPSTVANAGNYTVQVIVDACTSSVSAPYNVIINPAPANPTPSSNGPICQGSTLNLTANPPAAGGPFTFAWTGPNGFTSTLQNPSITSAGSTNAGTYSLTITALGGCTAVGAVNVVVNAIPATPPILQNGPLCVGQTLNLTTNAYTGSTVTYTWTQPVAPLTVNTTIPAFTVANVTTANAGTYSIRVTVNGCNSLTNSTVVQINTPPTVIANGGRVCEGASLTLTSTPAPAGAYTYTWSGPGGYTSNQQNPTLTATTLANAGVYTVTVSNGVNTCVGTDTARVFVDPAPATPSIVGVTPICTGAPIQLSTASSCNSFRWVGPGGFVSNAFTNTATPSTSIPFGDPAYALGNWSVICVSAAGCPSLPSTPVNIVANPIPVALPQNNGPVCSGAPVVLTGNTQAGATYQWFTDNAGVPGTLISTNQIHTVNGLANGSHIFWLIVTANGCASPAVSTTVTVSSTAAAPVIVANTPLCEGETLQLSTPTAGSSYTWTGPNGYNSSQQFPPAITNVSGIHAGTYSLSYVSNGCGSATASVNVVVNPRPAPPSLLAAPYCNGDPIQLSTAASCDTFIWVGPGGLAASLNNPLLVTGTNSTSIPSGNAAYLSGTWSLICQAANGCQSDPSAPVTVSPSPAPTATPSNGGPICTGQSLQLTAATVPGASYAWFEDNAGVPGAPLSTLQNPVVNGLAAGTYTYWLVVTTGGCPSAPASTTATVNPSPVAPTVTGDNLLCEGESLSLSTTAIANSYQWSGPNGFSSTLATPPAISPVTPLHSGTYSLVVTTNGCASPAGALTVVVNPAPSTPVLTSNSPICEGNPIVLSTSSTCDSFLWGGPAGLGSTIANPLLHTGTNTTSIPFGDPDYLAGDWQLICLSADGCASAPSAPVAVVINSVPVATIVNSNAPLCAGGTLQLSTASVPGASYLWTGPSGFSSNLQNPQISNVSPANAGPYQVALTVNGCTGPVSAPLNVVVNVAATVVLLDDTVQCANGITGITIDVTASGSGPFQYVWVGPNGFYSVDEDPVVPNATSYNQGTYTVSVTDANGCPSLPESMVLHITDNVPTPLITPAGPFCVGDVMTLTSTAYTGTIVEYHWSTPQGPVMTTVPSLNIPVLTAADGGNYSLYVRVDSCTSLSSAIVIVEVDPIPVPPNPGATYSLPSNCAGGVLSFTANGSSTHTYAWTGPNGFVSALQNPTLSNVTTAANGSYSLTVTNGGCSVTGSFNINYIQPIPATPVVQANSPVCEGDLVTLSSSTYSGGPVSYFWGTPTGPDTTLSASLILNPVVLADEGAYNLYVTVNGCPSLVSGNVFVQVDERPMPPAPSFSLTTPCAGGDLQLNALGNPAHTYAWTGPNGFASSLQSPLLNNVSTFANGTYTVTVNNGNCTSTGSVTLSTIVPVPATPTLTGNAPMCQGSPLVLTSNAYSGATVSYAWVTPQGNTTTSTASLLINPSDTLDEGSYTVQVTVNGCPSLVSGAYFAQIDGQPVNPVISFSLTTPCEGGDLQLNATGNSTYQYTWNGPNGFSSTLQNPLLTGVNTSANGTYSVQVRNGPCSAASALTLNTITPVPATPTITGPSALCMGDVLNINANAYSGATVSYVWNTPQGNDTTSAASLLINPVDTLDEGTYSLQVSVNGCTSLSSNTLFVQVDAVPVPPAPSFSLTTTCEGGDLQLSATGSATDSYLWSGPNGFSSTQQNPLLTGTTLAANGTYTVTVTRGGCGASGSVTLNSIVPIPVTPVVSGSSPLCEGSSLTLNANAYSGTGVSYAWSTPQGPQTTTSASLLLNPVTPLDQGGYSLIVTVNGCASLVSNSFFVQVDAQPVAPAPAFSLTTPCEGGDLQLNATGNAAHTYLWSGPNGYSSTQQNPLLTGTTIAANGTYTVGVSNGTCSALGTVTVSTIVPIPATPTITGGGSVCEGSGFTFSTPPLMGGSVAYIWSTPTGPDTTSIASLSINTSTLADSGFYAVQVVVDGCASLPSGAVLQAVQPIPATPGILVNRNPICVGDTLIFTTLDSAAAYLWAGPNGFSSTSRFPAALYPVTTVMAGVYSFSIMENGCYSALATDTIVVNNQPAAPTIVGPGTICASDTLRLSTGSNCGQYQWIGPLGSAPGTLTNPYLSTTTNSTGIPPGDVAYLAGNWQVHCIDLNGCSSPLSNTVSVSITPQPQTPSLNATGPHCAGANAQLFASGPAGAAYAWTGVGGFSSSSQNPMLFSVTPADSGTYSAVALLNGCVSDTAFIDLVVNAIPAAPSPTANGPVCSGAPIQLSANATAASYAWTGPNGFTSTLQNPVIPSASAVNDGFYFLTLTQNGCTSAAGNVQVQVIGSVTTPLVTSNSPICAGQMLSLTTNNYTGPSVQYIWSGPNGVLDTTSSSVYVDTSASTSAQGFYSVTVLVGGCSSLGSAPVFVTVNPIPGPPAIFTALTVCEGDPIVLATNVIADNYLWTGPNGFVSTVQQPPAIIADLLDAGDYTLQVTDNGCTSVDSSSTVTITVNASPSQPIIFSNSPVCIGDSLIVSTFGGAASYVWTVPLGTTVTTTDTFLVIFPAQVSDGGLYSVSQVLNGCASPGSAPTIVVVNDIPSDIAFAGEDFPICENPGVVRLDATPSANSGIWTTNSNVTIVSPTSPQTQITGFAAGGSYTFYWTVSNGACGGYSADSVVVNVLQPPDALTDYFGITENNLLENQSLVLNDTLYGQDFTLTILESPEHGQVELNQNLSINYTPNTDYEGPDQFLYEVCLEGCPDMCDTAYVLLEIGPELIVYDIITPNGDNDNEFFTIIGLDNFPDNELFIYNRWGNEVYAATNYQNDWAGTWDGKPLPDGTYFYVLLNGADGKLIRKGYVTLHR